MDGTTVSVSALGRIPPKNYHASAAGISPASTVSTASSRTTHSQPQPAQVQAQAQAQALGQGQSHAKSPLNHHHRYQPSQRVLSSVLATRQSQSRTANAQSHDSSSNNNHNNKKNASDTTASPYRPRSLFAAPLSQSTFASTTSTTATTHAPVGENDKPKQPPPQPLLSKTTATRKITSSPQRTPPTQPGNAAVAINGGVKSSANNGISLSTTIVASQSRIQRIQNERTTLLHKQQLLASSVGTTSVPHIKREEVAGATKTADLTFRTKKQQRVAASLAQEKEMKRVQQQQNSPPKNKQTEQPPKHSQNYAMRYRPIIQPRTLLSGSNQTISSNDGPTNVSHNVYQNNTDVDTSLASIDISSPTLSAATQRRTIGTRVGDKHESIDNHNGSVLLCSSENVQASPTKLPTTPGSGSLRSKMEKVKRDRRNKQHVQNHYHHQQQQQQGDGEQHQLQGQLRQQGEEPQETYNVTMMERSATYLPDPPTTQMEAREDDSITLTSVQQIVRNSEIQSQTGRSFNGTDGFAEAAPVPPPPLHRQFHQQQDPSPCHQPFVRSHTPSDDDDGDDDDTREMDRVIYDGPTQSGLSASAMTPDISSFFGQQTSVSKVSVYNEDDEEDDKNDDNGADDESQVSLSYEERQRQRKIEQERATRKMAAQKARSEMDGRFLQTDDVQHYWNTIDTPLNRTAAIVAGAACVGCAVLGPVGLLVGAATVFIGAGAMQIPEEQRANMLNSAQDSVVSAGDMISNTCVNTYRDSGVADRVPSEIQGCCPGMLEMETIDEDGSLQAAAGPRCEGLIEGSQDSNNQWHASETLMTGSKKLLDTRNGAVTPTTPSRLRKSIATKKGKVACLREGRIIPVAQIHSLDLPDQPRAWLDVLASANTSNEEKIEAIEEIIILAKDKQRARLFVVEEGILDSLMWIIGRYMEKTKQGEDASNRKSANPAVSRTEHRTAKLAATCCLTLGKAYCAAMHTEGDLLLMSLYERGTVPEERQLAQMLHEIPHHIRITKTDDPTMALDPSMEVFALRQIPLQQAEELAVAIKALSESMYE